jgi:hypothetical protein
MFIIPPCFFVEIIGVQSEALSFTKLRFGLELIQHPTPLNNIIQAKNVSEK